MLHRSKMLVKMGIVCLSTYKKLGDELQRFGNSEVVHRIDFSEQRQYRRITLMCLIRLHRALSCCLPCFHSHILEGNRHRQLAEVAPKTRKVASSRPHVASSPTSSNLTKQRPHYLHHHSSSQILLLASQQE